MIKEKSYNVYINHSEFNLTIDTIKSKFTLDDVTTEEVVKYLKGFYRNRETFLLEFIEKTRNVHKTNDKSSNEDLQKDFDKSKNEFKCDEFLDDLISLYDNVTKFTYLEAFKLKNVDFQAKVFGVIDVPEMIKNLGHKTLAVEGKEVRHKKYNLAGDFLGHENYHVIYETHIVNGDQLKVNEPIYALKCWCTTTEEEHWLWIEDKYKDSPLEAVASTFRIHENLIDNIKEIKRQGDVLIVEMKDDNIEPKGDIVPLTSEQYFSLLTAQS